MATLSLEDRIEKESCSIDGAAAFLMGLVQSDDPEVSRMAFAMGDLLERIGRDLDEIVLDVRKFAGKEL